MKKGVTLIELMVAISISTILMIGLTTAFSYMNRTQRVTMDNSKANYVLAGIKDYIQKNADKILTWQHTKVKGYFVDYDANEMVLKYHNEKDDEVELFDNIPFSSLEFEFETDGIFETCTIIYELNGNKDELEFVMREYNLDDIVNLIKQQKFTDTNGIEYKNETKQLSIKGFQFYNLPFDSINISISTVTDYTVCTIVYRIDGAKYSKMFSYKIEN